LFCWRQISNIPKINQNGELNYSFSIYIITYFVVVNWTLLQVPLLCCTDLAPGPFFRYIERVRSKLQTQLPPVSISPRLTLSPCTSERVSGAFSPSGWLNTLNQVTVAILLNSFLGAIHTAEIEAAEAASAGLKSKEMLRSVAHRE
jgi:hypothetical protein